MPNENKNKIKFSPNRRRWGRSHWQIMAVHSEKYKPATVMGTIYFIKASTPHPYYLVSIEARFYTLMNARKNAWVTLESTLHKTVAAAKAAIIAEFNAEEVK